MISLRLRQWVMGVVAVMLVGGLALTTVQVAPAATPSPAEVVHTAWRNLQVAEAYRFSTSLEQIIWPAPRLPNTGRSSQRDTLTLTGEANLPDRTLLMRLHMARPTRWR